MNVIGFVEGARNDSGGIRLVGIPLIHNALAKQGHHSVLIVCGQAMSGAKPFLCSDLRSVLNARKPVAFGIITYAGWGRWQFVPSLTYTGCVHGYLWGRKRQLVQESSRKMDL